MCVCVRACVCVCADAWHLLTPNRGMRRTHRLREQRRTIRTASCLAGQTRTAAPPLAGRVAWPPRRVPNPALLHTAQPHTPHRRTLPSALPSTLLSTTARSCPALLRRRARRRRWRRQRPSMPRWGWVRPERCRPCGASRCGSRSALRFAGAAGGRGRGLTRQNQAVSTVLNHAGMFCVFARLWMPCRACPRTADHAS